MPQQIHITRKLDLNKSAIVKGLRFSSKTLNYAVTTTDSGMTFIAANTNSIAVAHFTLPPANTVNGHFWSFCAGAATKFQVVGDANIFVDIFGATEKAVNFGLGEIGGGCTVACDGSKYYMTSLVSQTNASTIVFRG